MTEESLPEPQMIKQELISQFFQGCDLVSEINYRRGFMNGQIDQGMEKKLNKIIQALCLKLSMKALLKEKPYYNKLLTVIKKGKIIDADTCFEMLIIIGDILQELGPLKFEFVRGVKPEFAAVEGDFVEKS